MTFFAPESAVICPFVYGQIVAALLPDPIAYAISILSLLALLAVGLWLVLGVPDPGIAPSAEEEERLTAPSPAIVPPGEQVR